MMSMVNETPVQAVEKVPLKTRLVQGAVLLAAELPLTFYAVYVAWVVAQWFAPLVTEPVLRFMLVLTAGRVLLSGNLLDDFDGYVTRHKAKDPEYKAGVGTALAVGVGYGITRALMISLFWLIAWLVHIAL